MPQMPNLPDWLPGWVPIVLLLPTLIWALSFLFMPFSVFGVKSRLELIEARLDEIQNELRHVAARLSSGSVTSGTDYDEYYAPRVQEVRAERILTRPPIPPARHDLYNAHAVERPTAVPPERPMDRIAERSMEISSDPLSEPALEDRPPPSLSARPVRRTEPVARPLRAEPRMDWRR